MNTEDAVARGDRWLLQTLAKTTEDNGQGALLQGFCNAMEERPLVIRYQEAEPLLNIEEKLVPNSKIETESGFIRGIKMGQNMVLAPYQDADISTKDRRAAFLKSAYISIPIEFNHFIMFATLLELAIASGVEMLREISSPRPEHFQFRITHPSMGLNEPEGFCFLFRTEDQAQYYLYVSEKGVDLALPQSPFETIRSMSDAEANSALVDLCSRNPDANLHGNK